MKSKDFESEKQNPIGRKREKSASHTHHAENGREINAGASLEVENLRVSEVGQVIGFDAIIAHGAAYAVVAAAGNKEGSPLSVSVMGWMNEAAVPVVTAPKRRLHAN